MKDVSPDLKAWMQQGVTTLCTCIDIRRRDNQSFRFTDHDESVFVGGIEYVPYNSFLRTSISSSLELEVDGTEIHGILDSHGIDRAAISSGAFDFAQVRVFAVDWMRPDIGSITLRTGVLGEITMNEDGSFTAEIRGLTQVLAYRIGEVYSPECRADLGDRRCKIPLLISSTDSRWKPETAYKKGDCVLGQVNGANAYRNLSFINGSFDQDGYVGLTRDVTGWTTEGDSRGRWTLRPNFYNTTAKQGGFAAFGTDDGTRASGDIAMYQDIDLTRQGVSATAIDTGQCRLRVTLWHASVNREVGSSQLQVIALTGMNGGIVAGSPNGGIYDSGSLTGPEDTFVQLIAQDILIPAGTRALRFHLYTGKRPRYEEGAALDTITAAINDPNGDLGSANNFGGVLFQAQNDGTTGSTEPSWDNLIGNQTQDNDIVWTCQQSWHTVSYVEHSSTPTTLVPTYVFDADGYYDGGLLSWETGPNAGKVQEIKSWLNGVITLFYRPFYPMGEGDRFVMTPGCDKTRATCSSKFSNILNFRGEPDVPGQDKYYTGPDAPTTT